MNLITNRKEAQERFRDQSRELALLNRVRSAVAHELEVEGVLSRTLEAVAETYGDTRLCTYLLEDEELVLQHQIGDHEVNGRIPAPEGVFGRAVRTGDPVLVEDADPDSVGSTDGVTSEICVPLLDKGEVVGLIEAQSVGGAKLTQDDLRVLVAVCEQVGVALGRARLHARVRHSEGRYRALTQNSSDLVTLIEATGTVSYQSPAIERMLGYSPEELIGKNAFDYVHPDDLRRVETAFAEVVKDPGRHPSAEYRFRHKDGSWRWLESVGTNLTEQLVWADSL
jgi:PAS domain S-box-containing protein